jgi:hypothetical protein
VVALAVGVGVGDGVEGDAGVDGDGRADADELAELDGWGWEATVTTLASAGVAMLTDSPETRKPPVTRAATTARPWARDM